VCYLGEGDPSLDNSSVVVRYRVSIPVIPNSNLAGNDFRRSLDSGCTPQFAGCATDLVDRKKSARRPSPRIYRGGR
jgi:hypothetical protein